MGEVEEKVVDRFGKSTSMRVRGCVNSHPVQRLCCRKNTVNNFSVYVA